MKSKYKVTAMVPMMFSVAGNFDSEEAIKTIKEVFEMCRDNSDYADIVFDGIEETLRSGNIKYQVETVTQPQPELEADSDIRFLASDICDIFENSLKPITTPDQMSAPIHWNPMNEDWKMRLTKSQIYNTSSGFDTQTLDAMKKLHDKILTFGGDEVCMTEFDEDAPKILERGRFFYGSSYMRKGQDCQCHYNSARLWYKNKDRCFIATGYALSEDGLWRCHSWVVQPMARTVRVWETTVKRVAYFGVVLTSEECEDFVENNT